MPTYYIYVFTPNHETAIQHKQLYILYSSQVNLFTKRPYQGFGR